MVELFPTRYDLEGSLGGQSTSALDDFNRAGDAIVELKAVFDGLDAESRDVLDSMIGGSGLPDLAEEAVDELRRLPVLGSSSSGRSGSGLLAAVLADEPSRGHKVAKKAESVGIGAIFAAG